ncbi:MAG: hypothetical protein M9921_06275 [Fimbriimonadaceae bacterium]|nr:hypothetical protein [Chthonomonadaceae bacterium]MCO5296447.1 hypothetical protein [Fimbriimonadaceae bacterium]
MLSAVLALVLGTQGSNTVELYRGASIGASTRYWYVEDTTLDSTRPEESLGGLPSLATGSGKTVLIKFGDLDRALGAGVRVKDARLVLTVVGGQRPTLRGISTVQAPWGEGPTKTLTLFDPVGAKAVVPRWASTWRHRRAGAGGAAWQQDGALGLGDVALIRDATSAPVGQDQLVIGGLGPAVAEMATHWDANHGFALTFDGSAALASSQASPENRPRLMVEVEPAAQIDVAMPDLCVTWIEQGPPHARRSAGLSEAKDQDGQSVEVVRAAGTLANPLPDGEAMTYTAHIKNLGAASSAGHSVRWFVNEQPGASTESQQVLAPGEETTTQITVPYRTDADHRTQPIRIVVTPKGPELRPNNNALEIQAGARSVALYAERGWLGKFQARSGEPFESWVQGQVRTWNDMVLPQSRFSFAPDGVLERVRIQRIAIVDDGTLQGTPATPGGKRDDTVEAEWGFAAGSADTIGAARFVDRTLLATLSTRLGLASLAPMGASSASVQLLDGSKRVTRGSEDRFPGLMGGGDTRNEALLAGDFTMPYEPFFDPITSTAPLEATDLYSATDVLSFNARIGKPVGTPGEILYDVPATTLLRVTDASGNPVASADLELYQSSGGLVPNGPPTVTLKTSASGTVLLPSRPTGDSDPVATASGFALKANPFGRIDPKGGNGLFLVKLTRNGVDAWSYIKLWQLVDSKARSGKDVVFFDLRFVVPAAPFDPATNLATNRIVADNAQSPPARLSALVDGNVATDIELGPNVGDWVEIDLGRDRPAGEVRLVTKGGPMWQTFDIEVYETGQRPTEAQLWARELDWGWTSRNRSDAEDGGLSVAYRGRLTRFRFLRIVNTSRGAGKLAEVRVAPVKLEGPTNSSSGAMTTRSTVSRRFTMT